MSDDCFHDFQNKVSSCLLTECENPFSNPLQETCSGFPIAACVPKSVSKSACDPQNCSENRSVKEIESRRRNRMRLLEQSLELVGAIKETNRYLIFIFRFYKAG
jgi:hypothetical protein